MTRYLVIQTFRPGARDAVYARLAERGRMLPEGLVFIDSWLERGGDRCFQLMETADRALFGPWTAQWSDLVAFDLVELEAPPHR